MPPSTTSPTNSLSSTNSKDRKALLLILSVPPGETRPPKAKAKAKAKAEAKGDAKLERAAAVAALALAAANLRRPSDLEITQLLDGYRAVLPPHIFAHMQEAVDEGCFALKPGSL